METKPQGYDSLRTQLIRAIDSHDIEIMRKHVHMLKMLGVDLGEATNTAALQGATDMVKILLDNGAKAQGSNNKPVRLACYHGHLLTATLLIERGADPTNSRALASAAERNHKEVMLLLLRHGADPKAEDGEALRKAVLANSKETTEILLKRWKNQEITALIKKIKGQPNTEKICGYLNDQIRKRVEIAFQKDQNKFEIKL